MSRDTGGGPAKRPRPLERASIGWPRALRELKDLLYEVYLAAGAPSLDLIAAEVADNDMDLDGAPGRDTIRRCISGAGLPPGQADAVTIAAVLARRAAWDRDHVAARVGRLWVEARMATGKGRPIKEFDDQLVLTSLEVKPALDAGTACERFGVLPSYIPRALDDGLDAVVTAAGEGTSGIAVLVGGSSTGKTRAMWEAARKLPATWRLWHPIAPTRPDALLAELPDVAPRTVVWLNEAQLYLEPDPLGEQVAAGLRSLLYDPSRGPVLVLAALWPEHWDTLATRTEPDRHAHARELLSGHRIHVPNEFTDSDLAALTAHDGKDPRTRDAAELAPAGQIIQYLAGVPLLMERYEASRGATKHLIHAAMDARRLGAGPSIPLTWLAEAVPGYFTDSEWNTAGDWLPRALDYVTQECNGLPGILTPVRTGTPRNRRKPRPARGTIPSVAETTGPHYQLADYLDQYGRGHRADQIPPIDFWTAAATHAHPSDQRPLGKAAERLKLHRDAAQLYKLATGHGDSHAPTALVELLLSLHPSDLRPAQWAATHVNLIDPSAAASMLEDLTEAEAHEQVATLLARDPAAHVDLGSDAVGYLLEILEKIGAHEQMAALLARGPATHVDLHNCVAVALLLDSLARVGADEHVAALLARDPASHVDLHNPYNLYVILDSLIKAGADEQVAVLLARDPAAHVSLRHPYEVTLLLCSLDRAGAVEQAQALRSRAAFHADITISYEVNILLSHFGSVGMVDHANTLAFRAAAHIPLGDSREVLSLLEHLKNLWPVEHTALAARASAGVSLDNLHDVGKLVKSLRRADVEEHAMQLATRAAARAALDDPLAVADLLTCLRHAGAEEQAATLQARADVYGAGDNPDSIGWRLALMAATTLDLHQPQLVRALLERMGACGLDKETALLVPYLPATDRLSQLTSLTGSPKESRFGWEPDGSAAPPWAWDDLE
ncbi:hypothetical protein ACFCYH_35170 [Streptomyces sp. NPDC056400]|uniref:hypothetical protein n=1 Tax=Streptomyces sp. NPDC056400 TaxID=3345808 RepID=UPI0035E0B39B